MVQWNVSTLPLAKIFWSILVIEIIGFGVMMERRADWEKEQEFGEPVHRMLMRELEYNKDAVPDELRKALAKYEETVTVK